MYDAKGDGGPNLRNRLLPVIVAVGGLGLLLIGCGKGSGVSSSQVVATVNGDPITLQQYIDHLEHKQSVLALDPNGREGQMRVAGQLGFQGLEDLINDKLTQQMAKDLGVFPTPKDVDDEIKFQSQTNAQLVEQLQDVGLSLDDIRYSILMELCERNVITYGIKVTDQDVSDSLKANPPMTPDSVEMDWIYVHSVDSEKQVDQYLAAGNLFANAAMRFSEDPEARATSGRFPVTEMDQLSTELKPLVQKTPELKATDWIPYPGGGFAKFYISKKIKAAPIVITPHLREMVKRQIAMQRGEAATSLNAKLADRFKIAKVVVDYKPLQSLWTKAQQQLAQESTPAPAAETGTAGSTAGSAAPTTGSTGG